MSEEAERFYGVSGLGYWTVAGSRITLYPEVLKEHEDEFDWHLMPGTNLLWPHRWGWPLHYEED